MRDVLGSVGVSLQASGAMYGATTDQRGLRRPEPGEAMCDVGAFEVQQ